ncbi:MAG: hypothetical protein VW268_00725 [Rhodospirillaceae bacterium]
MGETTKPAFPQTPDGVTDWEKVFQEPARGLIPAIQRATNEAQIKQIMLVIIRQLFTRKNDELQVAQLTRQLDDLLAGTGGAVPTDAAVGMLWQIKEERQAKAAEYLAGKGEKKGKKNRRGPGGKSKVLYFFNVIFKNPKYLILTAVGLLLLLIAVIGGIAVTSLKPPPETAENAAKNEHATDAKAQDAKSPTPNQKST